MSRPKPNNKIEGLHPITQRVLQKLLEMLIADGWEPLVWETDRDIVRAAYLKSTGASKNGTLSMHCYLVAFDIICKKKMWSNPAFFKALHAAGKTLGLHSVKFIARDKSGKPKRDAKGNIIKFLDSPHLQLVPLYHQDMFRSMKEPQRDAYLAKHYPEFAA